MSFHQNKNKDEVWEAKKKKKNYISSRDKSSKVLVQTDGQFESFPGPPHSTPMHCVQQSSLLSERLLERNVAKAEP